MIIIIVGDLKMRPHLFLSRKFLPSVVEVDDRLWIRPEKRRSVIRDDVAEVELAKLEDFLVIALHQAVDGRMIDVGAGVVVLLVAIHFCFAEGASRRRTRFSDVDWRASEASAAHPILDAGEQARNNGRDVWREISEMRIDDGEFSRNERKKSVSADVALRSGMILVDGARDVGGKRRQRVVGLRLVLVSVTSVCGEPVGLFVALDAGVGEDVGEVDGAGGVLGDVDDGVPDVVAENVRLAARAFLERFQHAEAVGDE